MDFADEQMGDIPTRPMRVKVLYSFDHENKTNCLARFPDVLQIPAVAIDESSQVGVIELKQCLQAIVEASPELISQLSNGDFTIYAYDYSEHDSPLVGQGRLSAALTAATPTQQNKTMITGRVCKNVLGLFSNGVKETLEVKLRLTPVARPVQNEFTKSVESMRSMSPAMSGGFDPNAWNASVQQSKPQQQMNDYFNFDTMLGGDSSGMGMVDDVFGMATGVSGSGGGLPMAGSAGIAETPSDAFPGYNPAFTAHPHSAPGSRAGSPMMGSDSSSRNELLRHQSFSGNPSTCMPEQSRPGSRGSVGSEVDQHQRQASTSSHQTQHQNVQHTELYYNEDGQPRKRAKVQSADWRGRSSFGSKSGDLRVTAATAASMHMHRPIPRKAAAPGSNLEPPPRVPTPVPQRMQMLPQQQQSLQTTGRRSLLRQASTADSDFMSDFDNFSDAIVSSPDDDSPGNSVTADGSPLEIPSSPPVFSGFNQTQPSSPGLPTLPPPRMADSGYMSERGLPSSNVMESLEDEEDRSPDAEDYAMASQYRSRSKRPKTFIKTEDIGDALPLNDVRTFEKRPSFALERPGDMNRLPQKMLLNLPPHRREGSQGPRPPAKRPAPVHASTAPIIGSAPGSRRGSLALPPNPPFPSSDTPEEVTCQKPGPKKRQPLNRSKTQSNESEAGSPAPSDTEGGRPRGSKRSGSGAPRRKKIEDKLQESIAKGETPQYCSHCGAIETPTWRRIYIKECEGKPTPLDEAEGEGETIGVEVKETDEQGEATKFLVRKSMKKTKDNTPGTGFVNIMVCNPCGLWFNKFKVMRPSDKWGRKATTRRKTRKQKDAEEAQLYTDSLEPQSDAMFYTDQYIPEDAEDADVEDDVQPSHDPIVAPTRERRARANSMQPQPTGRANGNGDWNASQLNAALAREVQSSPARFHGSQQSPIEIQEITPKPTRRILFPSPRKDGEVKSLDDNDQASLKAMPHLEDGFADKPGMEFSFGDGGTSIFEAFTFDKENMESALGDGGHDLAHLFEGSPTAFFKTPRKTPSKNLTSPRSLRQLHHLLKTPTPNRTQRKPLTPNANAANNANLTGAVNDFMTSPSSSRYFLRSTPSRVERTGLTPGRRSHGSDGPSPWSRHLAQMLSDVNDGSSNQFTSPSRAAFDSSDLPTFNTPGERIASYDWEGLDMLSSEFAGFDGSEGAGGDTMI